MLEQNKPEFFRIIKEISSISSYKPDKVAKILTTSKIKGAYPLTKNVLKQAYTDYVASGRLNLTPGQTTNFLRNIKQKNIRTISGVTPVTVMTKPYPCPGKCIYCPNETNMPKSYISNEPGAQRALANHFDPYLQTYNRLAAFKNTGHPTDKVELIVIGGTWSFYPKNYQTRFITSCLSAMNDFNSGRARNKNTNGLKKASLVNEKAKTRCVGMSVETRPDFISKQELIRLRSLGVTKVQLGVQSLDDEILKKVRRGHPVSDTAKAFRLLRQFGFKIQVHWMPNLLGSNITKDLADYRKLCTDARFIPDEIKIYPCSLIENTKLMEYYKAGKWKPYNYENLNKLIKNCIMVTPRYCRISRIVRDISSEDIYAGNKRSNLRQDAEKELLASGMRPVEIRYREIKNFAFEAKKLVYKVSSYKTAVSQELFLEMVNLQDRIAGFLRLSFPAINSPIKELKQSAIIREVHVYGQSLPLGQNTSDLPQHSGIGKKLIQKALEKSKENNFAKIAVISAIGTKEYYRKLGFFDGTLYLHKDC